MVKTRICARAANIVNNRVYIIFEDTRQDVDDLWWLPGGGIENNEKIENGLKREINEELGIKKYKIDIQKPYIGHYTYCLENGVINVNLVYLSDFDIPEDITSQGEDKVEDQMFVPIKDLNRYCMDNVKEVLTNHLEID